MLNCRKPNLTGDSSSHYGVIFNRSTRHLISDGEHNSPQWLPLRSPPGEPVVRRSAKRSGYCGVCPANQQRPRSCVLKERRLDHFFIMISKGRFRLLYPIVAVLQ
jgi:hypothetical protein